jgi:hypothetical protein
MPRPAEVLDAPALVTPQRSGLFLAAAGPMSMPAHVTDVGAQWWSDACGNSRLFPAGCLDVPYSPYLLDSAGGLEYAFPFNVYASTVCPPVGNDAAESRERVRRRLLKSEQRQAERAFWGGQAAIDNSALGLPNTPAIKGLVQLLSEEVPSGITLLNGGTAVASLVEAVSLLEQQAADSSYDGPRLLHARKRVAAYAGSKGLVKTRISADGEHQYTHGGSEWVFGDGYEGTSPDDATAPDATTEYLVMTGQVYVWRADEPIVTDADMILNKVTNQRGMVAIRPYAIGVECFAAAVKFTRAG